MFRRSIHALKRFRDANDGITAVEFAVTVPFLALVTMAVIEFGMIMLVGALMEGGLREAARFGVTGREIPGVSRADQIIKIVKEHTLGFIDMAKADVQTIVYPSFAAIGKGETFIDGNGNNKYDVGETFTDANKNGAWDASQGTTGAGGSGQVVVYRITYPWKLITPYAAQIVGASGMLPISASVAVRNEPWEVKP